MILSPVPGRRHDLVRANGVGPVYNEAIPRRGPGLCGINGGNVLAETAVDNVLDMTCNLSLFGGFIHKIALVGLHNVHFATI